MLLRGDALARLPGVESESADLFFADPPFNIGYEYDVYRDRLAPQEYLDWSSRWMAQAKRVLGPAGTFWLAIGDAYVSELDVLARKEGFHRRSWVVWHYSFGVNCDRKLTPSKTHLLYYVKDPAEFTFNADAVKAPSLRASKYNDPRARPGGRLPNDVWVLDSKAACDGGGAFAPGGDVWFQSRVCGTFKERTGHPCQMPEAILSRIISLCSNPGDLVLDPFAGSGTTLAAAAKLGRRWLGCELSEAYCDAIEGRLSEFVQN